MSADLSHVLQGIADAALEELEREGKPIAQELRSRTRMLLEDQALVLAMRITGGDATGAQAAVDARLKTLAAAGLVLTAGQVQGAIRSAILAAIRAVFPALPPA